MFYNLGERHVELSKDLTKNQSLLFQTMWNVIAEGEEAAGLG